MVKRIEKQSLYPTIKVVAVGDGGIGKTSMYKSYIGGLQVVEEYTPTVFDCFESIVCVHNLPVQISLWDTAGQDCYHRIRLLSYPRTDLFLICYSVVEPSSFFHITEKWIPEISNISPHTPFLIVGLKSDLRSDQKYLQKLFDQGFEPIPFLEAESRAHEWGALGYFECSAISRDGLCDLFDLAFAEAMAWKGSKAKKKSKHCTLI